MIDSGLCRNEVNKRVRHDRPGVQVGRGEGMVPPSVHHGLKAVPGLRRGRADVRESEPVKPVPDAFVDAIRPHVSRQVWAMVELQRLSGMRPGEVCSMRTIDVDTSGRVWIYTPESHKTEHHGRERRIYLGPTAQEILRPWLRPELTAYLFSPAEAEAERRAEQTARIGKPGSNPPNGTDGGASRRKAPGERYDTSIPTVRRSTTASKRRTERPREPARADRSRIGIRTNSATTRRLGSVGSSAWTWPGPSWVIPPRL